jgi:hypothetical protein
MSHATKGVTSDRRRYVLASLSVQWRFRRMMRPAGLGYFRPERTREGVREISGAAQERPRFSPRQPQRCADCIER